MRIPINREIKIILLKWLQKGVINTDDIPALKKEPGAKHLVRRAD